MTRMSARTGAAARSSALLLHISALILAACAAIPKESVAPMRGRLELEVEPNPIVATPVGGNWYELKFDIIMREAGGVDVRIEDFTVDTIALKAIPVRSPTFPTDAPVNKARYSTGVERNPQPPPVPKGVASFEMDPATRPRIAAVVGI